MSTRASESLDLSETERIQMAQDLWDTIAADSPALVLSDQQRAELDRRVAEHDRDPASAIPWTEVREHLRSRFGA
jgi:putative addiction module component (TIGR02574 family)